MNLILQELSIAMTQDLCFNLVAAGCQSCILKQISGPSGLWSLVYHLCTPFRHSPEEREDTERLAVTRWKNMRELIDKLHRTPDVETIKQLSRLAYDVRRCNAFRKLLSSQYQQRQRLSQILERVGKVAKFFRSVVGIIRVAGSTTLKNKHIKIETVPSISRRIEVLRNHSIPKMKTPIPEFSPSQAVEMQRLRRRWYKYVVHAEMLLLTFYEENPDIVLATNYIGSSKRSCYLCANFIRLHNLLAVEGQHQQLYCLWTLPEVINFKSQERRANFLEHYVTCNYY